MLHNIDKIDKIFCNCDHSIDLEKYIRCFLALAGFELEPFSTVLCATIATISTIVRDTDTITKIFCHSDHLIDLEIKGFHSCVLDCLQPPITVEEYYLYDPECPIIYECNVELLGEKGRLLDKFQFYGTEKNEKQ